ncbi:MAG: hypothetical protein A2Y95_02500 [Deltaproteobacteria bacterium RBG_13_65_10]|nr:MAG: hypothetical protein A2Y95_02500 [Deltaproteobacteria bacterium RBG_13_65_10]
MPRYIGGRSRGFGLNDAALVLGDLAAEPLGRALDLLGVDRDAGQLVHQFAPLGEADHRPDPAHHAGDRGRERGAFQPQGPIAGAKAAAAGLAVIVSALQTKLPERAVERLGVAAAVAGFLSARTRRGRAAVVGAVGVEPPFHGPSRDAQHATARGRLDGLEVPVLDGARAYERFDLGDALGFERRFEPPFLAASCEAASGATSSASAHRSQARQYASTCSRNCRPASTCRRATSACSALR